MQSDLAAGSCPNFLVFYHFLTIKTLHKVSFVHTGLVRLLLDWIVQILLTEIIIRPRAKGLKNMLKVKPAWDLRPLPGLGRLEIPLHDPPNIFALLRPGTVLLHIQTLMPHKFPLGIRRFLIDKTFIMAPGLLAPRKTYYHELTPKKLQFPYETFVMISNP